MVVFNKAMDNIKPGLEVKSRRVGGATYQVPVEVKPERAQALAFRWLAQYARLRRMVIQWLKILLMKLLMHLMELVHLLRRKMILIRWQKLIRHLLIIDGNRKEKELWLVK